MVFIPDEFPDVGLHWCNWEELCGGGRTQWGQRKATETLFQKSVFVKLLPLWNTSVGIYFPSLLNFKINFSILP